MNKHLICLGLFWVAGIVGCGDRQSASPTVARATGTQQSNAEETEAMSGDSSLDASSTDSIPRSSGDPSGSVNQPTTTTRKERPVPEQEAIDAIRKLNGKVQYADASPTAPVTKVPFGGVRGADLGMLKDLATIEELDLGGGQSSVVDITFIAPLHIDLLKDIDFTKQAVDGNVSVTGNDLQVSNRTSGKSWPRVMLPRTLGIGDSYTLRCSFTHVKGPCGIVFPVGDHNTFLMLGGWDGATSGIQMIDGKYGDYNTTTVRNKRIADNATHNVELDVTQSGDSVTIVITLDNKPFTSYRGRVGALSLHQEVRLPDKQVIGLVAGDEAVFHSATLRVKEAKQ